MHPDLTVHSATFGEKKKLRLLSVNPVVYIIVLVLSIYGTYAYKLRVDGIFACSAEGYASDHYLADCNAGAYGDYDHGAFWFDLEPELSVLFQERTYFFSAAANCSLPCRPLPLSTGLPPSNIAIT